VFCTLHIHSLYFVRYYLEAGDSIKGLPVLCTLQIKSFRYNAF